MTTDNDALVRELLPCPFCGADAEIEQGSDHHGEWFNLGCSRHWGRVRNPDHQNTCIAGRIFYTETDVTEAEAIASWNTRPAPQPKPLDPPAQDEVEAVARFINPSAWAVMDSEKVRALRKYKGENIGWPVDQFQHKESMAIATAAITALRQHQSAEIEALRAENARLRGAALEVISAGFDHYTARNGRRCSIEGGDGEKCWIVPFDQFEALRAALEGGAK